MVHAAVRRVFFSGPVRGFLPQTSVGFGLLRPDLMACGHPVLLFSAHRSKFLKGYHWVNCSFLISKLRCRSSKILDQDFEHALHDFEDVLCGIVIRHGFTPPFLIVFWLLIIVFLCPWDLLVRALHNFSHNLENHDQDAQNLFSVRHAFTPPFDDYWLLVYHLFWRCKGPHYFFLKCEAYVHSCIPPFL